MLNVHLQYITDHSGEKISVLISIDGFDKLIEEFEGVRLYNEAKADNEPSIPIDEAFKTIEQNE